MFRSPAIESLSYGPASANLIVPAGSTMTSFTLPGGQVSRAASVLTAIVASRSEQ